MAEFGRRTPRERLIALAGIAAIVGVALVVLWALGVLDSASGEPAELVDTPAVPGMGDARVGPRAGEIAPDFEMSDFDGLRHRLSDYRGRVVFINFWATWCVPCRAELPEIYALQNEFVDTLAVLTVNAGEDTERARNFFRDLERLDGGEGVSFTVNGTDPGKDVYGRYQPLAIDALPVSVFVDERGVVSRFYNGQMRGDEMREAIEEALR
jgi:thiol-disulfide isomerase/thioredoxin